MKVETVKMKKIFLDGAFFGTNVILSAFLFLFNPGKLWVAFLVLWGFSGFVYPIAYKKILNKNSGSLSGLMEILLVVFISFLIGFMTFMMKTGGFIHKDWESLVFFKYYTMSLIVIVGISFTLGRLLTNYWLQKENK